MSLNYCFSTAEPITQIGPYWVYEGQDGQVDAIDDHGNVPPDWFVARAEPLDLGLILHCGHTLKPMKLFIVDGFETYCLPCFRAALALEGPED